MRAQSFPLWSTIAGLLLLSCLAGCFGKKEEVVPYYEFTQQDQEWLRQTAKSEWRFTNDKGEEKRFRIDTVVTNKRWEERTGSSGIIFGNNKLLYYYDSWYMRISRTDSVAPAGYFQFTTASRHKLSETGLVASGQWYSYIGTEYGTGNVACQEMYFGDVQAEPYQQLTISGRRYERVLLLETNGRAVANCFFPYPTRTAIRRIHYDQIAGIVRMEDKSGEIWNRVP